MACVLLSAAAVLPTNAWAAYPDHPIRLVIPWPAGGSGDLVGRIFADVLSRKLGVSVIADNRAGANGIIGITTMTRATPDGYTLGFTTSEPLTINPSLYPDLPYDVEKQLEPLALVARTYFVIAANKAFAADDIQGAIALAKQHPGKYTVGSYGIADMFLAYFESATSTSLLRVPYQGAAPAMAATLAGTVDLTLIASSTALGAGSGLKVLGVGSSKPIATLPGVPTFIEQGLPAFEIGNWLSVLAPKGLAEDARSVLQPAIEAVARSEEFKERLRKVGIEADYQSAGSLATIIRNDSARWQKLAIEKNMRAQ